MSACKEYNPQTLRHEGISSRWKQPKSSLLDDSILIIIIMPWLYMHIYNLMRMMIIKLILKGEYNKYDDPFSYQCFMCEPGCVTCDGPSPCVLTLNWVLRSILLAVSILILCGIPLLVWFTFQYRDVKVTRDVCQHLQQPNVLLKPRSTLFCFI